MSRSWLISSLTAMCLLLVGLPALTATADAAGSGTGLSVPYGSSGWSYKIVGHGAEPGFEASSYDDSAWSSGTAPFGTVGCSGTPAPVTYWQPNTDLLVRRTLSINPDTLTGDLSLKVAIDNDVDVFFNGTLIASNDYEGCGQEKARFDIPRSLVTHGANTLAVRAIDRGQINYLDLDLTVPGGEEPDTPPVVPHDLTADAGPDQSVDEGSVVTLDGSGSKSSTKPVLAASEQVGSLPGGTSLAAHVEGLDPDAAGLRLTGSVDVGQGPASQNTSVAYVVDVSGSTNDIVGCGDDANGDRRFGTVLDCEVAAVVALHQKVVESGSVQKVALISFNSGATARDLDPTSGTATLIAPDADKDGNGVLDLVQAVRTLRQGGGTAFAPPTRLACQLLATTGSTNLVSAFMSDGEANDVLPPLPCSPPVTFQTFAVGAGSSCTYGSAGRGLDDIAAKTGGTCLAVPDVTDLPDILPQIIASQLTKVSYTIDDQDPVDISSDLGLPVTGPADRDLAITLPDNLAAGTHRICVTAEGTDSGGLGSVTTCSDLTSVSGQLTYQWRQVGGDGPPVFLSNVSSAHPSFVAPDDGTYTFELTVSDSIGGTATDTVQVTGGNIDPTLSLTPGDAYVGGVTQVNGTFTDPGWLDSHRASVDWGDGTTDQVPVSVQGSGWGSLFGSHVYTTAGSYQVSVTLHDDDGGTATKTLSGFQVSTPVAVWANSTSTSKSLNWGGSEGNIWGRVHTNGLLRFVGAAKTVEGPATYAGALSADTTRNSFIPAVAQAPVQDYPVTFPLADYRPDGKVAHEVGSAYHDMTAACAGGTWHDVQVALADGVYYAPCPIQLNGSDIGGRVTLISDQTIKISGSRPAFEPYLDGLLLLAGSSSTKAIDVATSSSKFLGVIFAGSGEVSISGSSNRFYCGILGDRIDITGGDTDIHGATCGRPDSTVASPVLVPDLRATLGVDKPTSLPGEDLGYHLDVTNAGTTLVAPALIGLQNVDDVTETVTGYDFAIERLDAATGAWVPLATKGDSDLRLDLRSNPYAGVSYPADAPVAGTTVPAGGWATWGLQAVLTLTPGQVSDLLDPAVTAGIRLRSDFSLSPSGAQARRLFTYGDDFIDTLRSQGADVTSASATFVPPSGAAETITPDGEAGLATIKPGDAVTVARSWSVPVPAAHAEGETDQAYLARLQALDGTHLTGASFVLARGGVGQLVAPLSTASTTRQLPVVKVATSGPTTVTAGTSADYQVKLTDVGSRAASGLTAGATSADGSLTVTGAPGGLDVGEVATASTTYHAHTTPAGGTVPIRGSATWTDAVGNHYGETGSTVQVSEQLPAKLSATLADQLVGDPGSDGATSPGDTVRYTMIVRNSGDATMTGVHASIPLDASTAFKPGSGVVPAGGTLDQHDGTVDVVLPDIIGQTAQTVTFDVVVADPFPVGVRTVSTQGTVSATGQDDALTDDVTEPGVADPTVTPIIPSYAALSALLSARLVVDADGDGTVTAGDTLAYSLDVASIGTQIVTGIKVDVPAPTGTALVDGSLTTTQGTASAPGTVTLGDLGPFQGATIDFRAKVAQPVPTGLTAVSVQAQLRSDQVDLLSDDPSTSEAGDPTVVPVGNTPGTPDQNGPVVGSLSPAEGTVVTEPTHITTTLTAPDGLTLDTWVVDYRRADDTTVTVLASGTGSTVDAVLDPTVMPNGTYVVTVRGTTTLGGLTTREVTVVVDGAMKLGRYTTTLTDLTVGVAGLPIQVQRSYDSFDKTTGDFGVGWRLDLANFQVSSNGPLGEGGWTMEGCGGGLIFVTLCFKTDRPHFVTVTWPDGHNEYFDLTPAEGSTFFSGLTSARFTARPGSTSTLQATDSSLFWVNGNLNGGAFGFDGIYNPTSFVLTDKYGTKYTLEVGKGLKKIEDRVGNVTSFTHNGITSSNGPAVTFDRDAEDRITKVTGPDGHTVGYSYNGDGDLASVTNQLGNTTTYSYLPGHYLDKVTGPDSAVMARFEYTDGRITAVIDGAGNRTEISSDLGSRQETVTDPGGARTTIRSYDGKGLLVESNEVYGGQSHVTQYGYDADRNMTLRRDPAGHEWHATYTKGNVTSLTTPSGAKTAVTYNDLGAPLTWTDPEGHVTTYTWNGDGTLASIKDALGHSETYTYTDGLRTGKTDRDGKVWAWTYTSSGLLKTERDPLGNVTTHEYDADGHETAVVDALGHRTETTYDAAGNVRTTKDADGHLTENVYDDLNQLVRTIDPTGHAVDYDYDGAGRTVTVDNHVDAPTHYAYDAVGQQTSTWVGTRNPATTTYDGAGAVLTSTDEVGRVRTNTYNPDGNLHTVRNAVGGVTTYTYTPDGHVATEEDPLGNVTTYDYWPTGRLKSVTDPLGRTTSHQYDALGQQTVVSFTDGSTTHQQYDAAGHLVAQTDGNGDATRFEYDDAGRPIATVDGEGRRTETTLDAAGRAIRSTAPDAGVTQREYTPAGLVQSETTPQGVTATYAYDAAGRTVSRADELGHLWTTTYDDLGRVLTERDPRQQGSGPATATNVYDGFGNLASTTDALGHTVSFGYDDAGQRTSVTDPRGKTWRVDYHELGGVARETDPLDRVRTSTYDAAGLLRSTTDARGTTVDYAYDGAQQLVSMSDHAGSGSVQYGYDDLGRRSSMTDATGRTTWTYYPDGAIKRIASPAGEVSYAYDRSGLRTSMTTPAGTVGYTYDLAGRIDTVRDAAGRTFDVGYDSDGRLRSLARPNGVETSWSYDDASRLVGITHQRGATTVDAVTYGLDADGNRTSATTPDGVETYTLNPIDQLTAVSYPGGPTTTYTYDAAGNRASSKSGSAPQVDYTYDAASELTSVGGDSVTHDAAGNLTSARGTSYDWDWLGRMVGVDGPAVPGGRATYSYDGDGVRVAEDSGSGSEPMLYDRATTDGLPDLVQKGDQHFLHLVDGVVEADGSSVSYPLADGLGSVRKVTGADGAVTGTTSYDAFGGVRATSGTPTPFGFAGAPQSGDLVHLNARDLDTELGRFLSTDPVRPGASGVVGWNPYTYVANNPATATDPSGQVEFAEYLSVAQRPLLIAGVLLTIGYAVSQALSQTCLVEGTCPLNPPWGNGGTGGSDAGTTPSVKELADRYLQAAKGAGDITAEVAEAMAKACLASAVVSAFPGISSPCSTGVPLFFVGLDTPQTLQNTLSGLSANPGWVKLHRKFKPWPRGWLRSDTRCSGMNLANWCDEYPFASSQEGGGPWVSLKVVPAWEQRIQSGQLGSFYGDPDCKIGTTNGVPYAVVPGTPITAHYCN